MGKNFAGNRFHDIVVTLAPELKKQPGFIGAMPVRTLDGSLVRLDQLAEIHHREGRYNILHQNAQRKQTITCDVEDRDIESFVKELKTRVLQNVEFSADIYPEFTGAAFEQAQARNELILVAIFAGIGVLLLIYIAIGSFRNTLLTLGNLPFSLVGGIAAVMITGATLSVGLMIGFITLFGITVRNSIMLLSHYRYLVNTEGQAWNLETAIQGAQERLTSILMTALVTALAMFPVAFDSDNPGREIMGPMASIIIGGLASSTVLNLLLFPAIFLKFGDYKKQSD